MDEIQKVNYFTEKPMNYASLGGRIKACIIDGFIISVIYGLLLYLLKDQLVAISQDTKSGVLDEDTALFIACMTTILFLFIDLWYYVLFARKHRGTFGQLTQDLRIALRDGTVAGFNAVSLRHVPGFLIFGNICLCGWLFFFLPLQSWMAKIPIYLICITHGYLFLTLFVIAANGKRKSMSDLWSHTAVIHKSSLKKQVEVIFVDETEKSVSDQQTNSQQQTTSKVNDKTVSSQEKSVPLDPKNDK